MKPDLRKAIFAQIGFFVTIFLENPKKKS